MFKDLGFEPRESHASAHALIMMDSRDTQGRKSSGLGFYMDGAGEGSVKKTAQVTGRAAGWSMPTFPSENRKGGASL